MAIETPAIELAPRFAFRLEGFPLLPTLILVGIAFLAVFADALAPHLPQVRATQQRLHDVAPDARLDEPLQHREVVEQPLGAHARVEAERLRQVAQRLAHAVLLTDDVDVPVGAIGPLIVSVSLRVVPMRSLPVAEVARLFICAAVRSSEVPDGVATPRLIGTKDEVPRLISEPLVTG